MVLGVIFTRYHLALSANVMSNGSKIDRFELIMHCVGGDHLKMGVACLDLGSGGELSHYG